MKNLYTYLDQNLIDKSNYRDHLVSLVTDDSRECKKNSVFFCLTQDKEQSLKNIYDAIKRKAKTILIHKTIKFSSNIINVINLETPDVYFSRFLKLFYENYKFPIMIGITGTCGKTTTSTILYHILKNERRRTLLIGTNGFYGFNCFYENFYETANTTPTLKTIYDLLFNKGIEYEYCIMEVSSQALDSNRILGLVFDYVVFLNLSNEHLDYHLNIERYLSAKKKLFTYVHENTIGLVNSKSPYYKEFLSIRDIVIKLFNSTDYKQIELVDDFIDGMRFKISDIIYETKIPGSYNLENLLCVYKLCQLLKINANCYKKTIRNIILGGRNQYYHLNNRHFIIDYAHTSKEVEVICNHLISHKKNKIIIVIGCGGNRDKSKRPVIGNICTKSSDIVIFTEDNSRDEKTLDIINEIICGVFKNNYYIETDRYKAIKKAIELSDKDDIIAVLGKGIEKMKYSCDNRQLTDSMVVKNIIGGLYE